MARKKWSYTTGEKGRNRVRAFADPRTGIITLEFYDAPLGLARKKRRLSLKHRDRDRAKRQADGVAADLAAKKPPVPELTLKTLFDIYLGEVTPGKGESKGKHDRRAAEMFLRFFGPQCKPASLNRRDWDRFIMERLAGRIRPAVQQREGKVKARIVEYDLRFLLGVLNWATVSRDHAGNLLLNANPLKGLKVPKEEAPNRPIVSEEQYRSLVETAAGMDWRFRLLLILVNETGHRVGAVRVLRWSDVDLSKGSIRWRAENDKIGYEHTTPLTEAAISALEEARRQLPGIGDAWVFPSPSDAGEPCSRHLVRDWWERAEDRLDWPTVKGRGWHSLRRKFATEMDGADLKALCQLGGWKDPVTILKCYKQPDQAQLKEALSQRKRLVGGAEA